MKSFLIPIKLTLVLIVLSAGVYPLLIAFISKMAPGAGKGETVVVNGKVVGYAIVGK